MSARAALALSALLVSAAVDAQEPPRAPRGVRPLPAAKANASAPKAPLRTAPRTAGKAPGARRATPAGPRTAPIRFEDACAPGDIVTVGVAGDVLFHAAIQRAAYATPEGFFAPLAPIREVIESVDLAIANQETVLSCCNDGLGVARANPGRQVDHHVYGSSNSVGINAAPFLAFDLKAAGFDAMTTANNHALDRGTFGVHATLDSLERAELLAIGTRHDADTPWVTRVEVRGMRLALLACTQWTNGPVDDEDRVRPCFDDEMTLLDDIAALSLQEDVDGVVLLPHAGTNRAAGPEPALVSFARAAVDAGALAVLINGRHVVQPWEKRVTRDRREALIVYSIGDLVSDAEQIDPITSVMVVLGLARGADGKARLRGAKAVPLHYSRRGARPPHVVRVLDARTKLVEERALVLSRVGPANVVDAPPYSPVAECAEGYVEPPPWRGSVGDGCRSDVDCDASLKCLGPYHDMMCTRACERDRDCAALPGRAAGACVPYPTGGKVCLASCARAGACRDGFTCAPTAGRRSAQCTPTSWDQLLERVRVRKEKERAERKRALIERAEKESAAKERARQERSQANPERKARAPLAPTPAAPSPASSPAPPAAAPDAGT